MLMLSPTVTVLLPESASFVMLISSGTTSISRLPETWLQPASLLVAVIVHFPIAFGVTLPFWSTVATLSLLVVHATTGFVTNTESALAIRSE